MIKTLRPIGLLIFGVGFAILLVHGLRVYRIQSGLAELVETRRSMIDGAKSDFEAQQRRSEFNKIREQYRRRGISHPHYEDAFAKSPAYYGTGLVLVAIGAVMFWFSRKYRQTPPADSEPQPPDESRTES